MGVRTLTYRRLNLEIQSPQRGAPLDQKLSPKTTPARNSFLSRTSILVIAIAITTSFPCSSSVTTSSSTPQTRERTLVCVVSAYDPTEMNMDAVVVVENGKFRAPFPEENEAAQKEFATDYFKPGKKYRLTFGGGEVGTAVVKTSDVGCNNIHARVGAQGGTKIRGHIMGLATNSETLGRKESSRRAPTDEERGAVMEVVKQIYRSRKTSAALLRLLTTTNLAATDLNGDAKFELVGSFVIQTPNKARRDLLLIAEPDGTSFKAGLIEFQTYKLPPEDFDSAIDFVDQLDIDGDGVAEVFANQQGFDAYSYSIYKKQNGRWRQVYSFIGDAC
jgi:hypothetical protein